MLISRRTRMRIARWAGSASLFLVLWSLLFAPAASASGVSGVHASVSATQAGATSTYSITFTATHGLTGGDQVILFAHSGTVFPTPGYTCPGCAPDLQDYYLKDNVRNAGVLLSSVSSNPDGSILYINLAPDLPNYPNDVPPGRSLTMIVMGVINPTRAAAYTLMVATTDDTQQVTSNAYSITPGPAAGVTVSSGDGQAATVLSPFASPLRATVVDQYGNAVPNGGTVDFVAPATGPSGTFAGGSGDDSVGANSAGVATSSAFTADTQAGSYDVQATLDGGASGGTFALTNLAGPATQLSVSAGDNQSGPAGEGFSAPLAARLLDRFGNPVSTANEQITFTAPTTGAGGTFTSTGSNTESDLTDTAGIATSSMFTANGALGTYTVQATAPGVTSTAFTLTNVVGPPARIVSESGDGQSAQVGQGFVQPLAAEVTDQFGHPIAGESVTFTAPASDLGATFDGGGASDTERTDASGIATSENLTAGTVAGGYQVTAGDGGIVSSFTLTNTPGPAAELLKAGGDVQSTPVGSPFAAPLKVQLADRYGNPVLSGNVPVTFAAPPSGAGGTFATTGSNSETDLTDSSGVATSSTITADPELGTFAVAATSSGIADADFSLSNEPGPPARLTLGAGAGQSSEVGSRFAKPLEVEVTDAYGHPLAGQSVTFTAPAGGDAAAFAGGATRDTETTDSSGIATSGELTAGDAAGTYAVQATAGDLSPVVFSLTNTAGAPAKLVNLSGDLQSAQAGQPFAAPLRVRLVDRYGNPVQDMRVAFTAPSSGPSGTFASSRSSRETDVTDASGIATSSTLTAGGQTGTFAIAVAASGVPATSFALTDLSAPAAAISPGPQPGTAAANGLSPTTTTHHNRFLIGRVRVDRRNGTAKVTVMLPGPGVVILSGHWVKRVRVRVDRARKLVLRISTEGALGARLMTRGRARVTVRVRYAPNDGPAITRTRTIVLRMA